MTDIWFSSALWIGLALAASLISIRLAISVALIEICVGAVGGNLFHMASEPWVLYLAGLGSILLTFLAGAEVDPIVLKKQFWPSFVIGALGFFPPFLAVMFFTRYALHWNWAQCEIAGLSLSCTSVAVVYAVMVETGFNRTEIGKVILAACFINDLGTVLFLGVLFANYNGWLLLFVVVTPVVLWLLPRTAPLFFRGIGGRISEPEIKFIMFVLFLLGGLAGKAKSEAVLPAYLVGMVMAPYFLSERLIANRMRVVAFTFLTPFFFLRAGSLIHFNTVVSSAGLIFVYLIAKVAAKFVGILPATRAFGYSYREGMYTTLMMCTGLTFGSICALFGLNNKIINQQQYTILLTAIIASAVIPTIIAQKWYQPEKTVLEEVKI